MSTIAFPYVSVNDINDSIIRMENHLYQNWSTYLLSMGYIREYENILSKILPCDMNTFVWLKRNFHKIDLSMLSDMAMSKFYDVSVMNTLLCVISSMIWSYPKDDHIDYASTESLRYLFNRITVLSKRDINTILTSSIGDGTNPSLILKASNSPMYNNDNNHEIVVGVYGTNELRNIIPNFAYVFGGFRCTKPIHIPTNNIVSLWCRDYELSVVYTIYENIYPSMTLKEYIAQPDRTPDDVVKVYLQILLALKIARDTIQFTHYDLHDENVLIRKTNLNRFYIKYPYNSDTTYYIETDNIPTIIDYGYSHIVYDNKHYGKYGLLKYSILHDSTFDAYDHYKLLMFMYYNSMISSNSDVHDVLLDLIVYLFDEPDSDGDEIYKKRDLAFQLPNLEHIRNVKHEVVIDYIINKFPHLVRTSPDPNIPVIQCGYVGRSCMTIQDSIRALIRPNIPPRIINLFNYQDVGDIEDIDLISEVNNAVNYIVSIMNYIDQVIPRMRLDTHDYIVYFDSFVIFLSYMILIYECINREISLIDLLHNINMSQYVERYMNKILEHIIFINNTLDTIHNNQDIISNPGVVYTRYRNRRHYIDFLKSKVWLLPKLE